MHNLDEKNLVYIY